MSVRLYYKRRVNIQAKPLLIISYDGVLGFTRNRQFHMRPKVCEFMKKVRMSYQIVITKLNNTKHCEVIMDILIKKGISFDALYLINPDQTCKEYVFYEQIYKDFKISNKAVSTNVYWLIPLNVDNVEYKLGVNDSSLFARPLKKNNWTNEINLQSIPLPSKNYTNTPTLLITQNAKASIKIRPIYFPKLCPEDIEGALKLNSNPKQSYFVTNSIWKYVKSLWEFDEKIQNKRNAYLSQVSAPVSQRMWFSGKVAEDLFTKLLARNSKIQVAIKQNYER